MTLTFNNKLLLWAAIISITFFISSCNSDTNNDKKELKNNHKSTPSATAVIISSGTMGAINGESIGCDVVKESSTYILNGEEKIEPTAMLSPRPKEWITSRHW